MAVIKPTDERVLYLCKSDTWLRRLIETVGPISWNLKDDFFASLVHSIVSQQLSNKAAASIYNKLETRTGSINPKTIAAFSEEDLKALGLSQSKTRYIQGLAKSILSGELNFKDIRGLSDSDVVTRLTQIKGIGQWTAEMFLIFSLHRENILSFGDAGLQSTIKWLYSVPDAEVKAKMAELQRRWSPYNTLAALYLWEAVDQGYTRSERYF